MIYSQQYFSCLAPIRPCSRVAGTSDLARASYLLLSIIAFLSSFALYVSLQDVAPVQTPVILLSRSTSDFSVMRSVEIPSSWTSLSKADTTELPSSWAEHIPPSELTFLCDRVNPPTKLLEILQWSLERPSCHEQHVDKTGEHPAVTEQCPDDRTDSIPVSTPCPQYSDDVLISRLRSAGSKNDLVSVALCKLAALKAPRAAKRPAVSEPAPAAAPLTDECTSCFDDIPTCDLVRLSCSHYYCKPCLASLVLTAIQNESAYGHLLESHHS